MTRTKSVIREKTIYCQGISNNKQPDFLEIDLFPFQKSEGQRNRGGKTKMTIPKQKALNDKNSRRSFCLLAKTNFGIGDIHLTLSYAPENMPASLELAMKDKRNFERRLKRVFKKEGLELKHMTVPEVSSTGRIHFHMLINCCENISRERIEEIWDKGFANSKTIQNFDNAIETLCNYLSKDPAGKKRWYASRNLKRPEISTSDTKVSKKRFQQLSLFPEDCEEMVQHFEKEHPGYKVTGIEKFYNEITCSWYIRARLQLKACIANPYPKKEKTKPKPKPKTKERKLRRRKNE